MLSEKKDVGGSNSGCSLKELGCRSSFFNLELEKKRKEKAALVYERKKQLNKLKLKAEKVADEKLGAQLDVLALVKY
ncbi:hypothetical protein RJT34_23091 [Clitoria ternatea]|uniref:Uncharacterized protein n=1 Tax=Clitoria ternatea TaxID=43366 RepID=A0AAN9FS61_CLITE